MALYLLSLYAMHQYHVATIDTITAMAHNIGIIVKC